MCFYFWPSGALRAEFARERLRFPVLVPGASHATSTSCFGRDWGSPCMIHLAFFFLFSFLPGTAASLAAFRLRKTSTTPSSVEFRAVLKLCQEKSKELFVRSEHLRHASSGGVQSRWSCLSIWLFWQLRWMMVVQHPLIRIWFVCVCFSVATSQVTFFLLLLFLLLPLLSALSLWKNTSQHCWFGWWFGLV